MSLPKFHISSVTCFERPVEFRMPFRYGVVTLRESPEAYVAVRITFENGDSSTGYSADLLAPKWFDKSGDLSNEDNFDQLRKSTTIAAELYRSDRTKSTGFGHHLRHVSAHHAACKNQGLPGLVAGFGVAQMDRAIVDAVCRYLKLTLAEVVQQNLMGITVQATPDLADFDLGTFFATLKHTPQMLLRHTVGMTDVIDTSGPVAGGPNDGLPQTLRENCQTYGLRAFKIKLCGDAPADIARLTEIASVLDALPQGYFSTLDGNEQFSSPDQFQSFWQAAKAQPELEKLMQSVKIIEQPITRQNALSVPLDGLADLPCEIDESDAEMNSFAQAQTLGYRGVSSKSCKGIYRSLLNRARVTHWNNTENTNSHFMSAEDLCTQGGFALQQDLALANLIGCGDVERNGHQYGDGLAGTSHQWRHALMDAHPDLYSADATRLGLNISGGKISLKSVTANGYGTHLNGENLFAPLTPTAVF